MEPRDDDLELRLRQLGNIPVPDSLLKDIQARLGQFTPQWAEQQKELAYKCRYLDEGDHGKNLALAIAHFQNVLHAYTSTAFPFQRAQILYDLGNTYRDLSALSGKDRLTLLDAAVACYKESRDIAREHHLAEEWIANMDHVECECYQQRMQELKRRADAAQQNGDNSLSDSQRASALGYYSQAIEFYRLVESYDDEAIVLQKIAGIQRSLQNPDTAISMGKEVTRFYMEGMEHGLHHTRSTVLDPPVHRKTSTDRSDDDTRNTLPPDDPATSEGHSVVITHKFTDRKVLSNLHIRQNGLKQKKWLFYTLFVLLIVSGICWQIVSPLQQRPIPQSISLTQPYKVLAMNPHAIELTVNTTSTNLLAQDQTTLADIERQIQMQFQQENISNVTAAMVLTFASGVDVHRDQQVAHQINTLLRSMNKPNIVFDAHTVFLDNFDLGKPDGAIAIEIYVSSPTIISSLSLPTDLLTLGTLTVASDTTYPPLEYVDTPSTSTSKTTGFDIDLITAMAHLMHLKLVIESVPFNVLINNLNAKRYDLVISSQMITEARKKQVDFIPYFKAGMSLLVRKGNPQHIESIVDLCGQSVGVQDATVELDILNAANRNCQAANKPSIQIQVFKYQTDVVQLLLNNLVTAIFQDSPITDYYQRLYADKVEVASPLMNTRPEGISIRKGDISMFNAIQTAFNVVQADGTYDALFKKWQLDSAQKI